MSRRERVAQRVAAVAAGVTPPIGQDLDAFWSSLLTGASGISTIERFPVADLRVGRGGEIKKLHPIKRWDRVPDCRRTRLLLSAPAELIATAPPGRATVEPSRLAVVVGTALGGVEEGERALAGEGPRRRLRGALYDSPGGNLPRSLWARARAP